MADADPNLSDAHTEIPSLKGRKAIISGGTTGIGRAIAVLLASEGAKVFVCGRTPEHLFDIAARLLEHPHDAAEVIEAALKAARARLSFSAVARELNALFERLER